MYQAYRQATRNKPILQKEFKKHPVPQMSHEIQDNEPVYRIDRPIVKTDQALITKEQSNINVMAGTSLECKYMGNIKGCLIQKGAELNVALGGHVSQIIIEGALTVHYGGHARDIEIRRGGKLIIESGGEAKRVFVDKGASEPVVAAGGRLTKAIYNRVTGFPIII